MATTVTVKGQVTIPKKVREAAGIKPGDRVEVRARAGGGVIVEREPPARRKNEAGARIDRAIAELRRQGIKPTASTGELMRLLRGED
jgi:AbrB family looped-hinge helix DNA binding protein